VHVGAHAGEELETYLAAGFAGIALVEPHPLILPRLAAHAEFWQQWLDALIAAGTAVRAPEIRVVPRAAAATARQLQLYLTQVSLQSSALAPVAPFIVPIAFAPVLAEPLDAIVENLGWDHASVDLLVIDVQGMELDVLRGAEGIVAAARCIVVEIDHATRYAGQPAPAEIRAFLSARGFACPRPFAATADITDGDETYVRIAAEGPA
jgi:FkbM family methyltransferase